VVVQPMASIRIAARTDNEIFLFMKGPPFEIRFEIRQSGSRKSGIPRLHFQHETTIIILVILPAMPDIIKHNIKRR
jgi:hypothetical protein